MICVIRVDSSSVIGSGHLMRCLTLADKMKKEKNADVHFICRNLKGNLSQLVVSHGHQLHLLPRVEVDDNLEGYAVWLTVSQERDAAETISILKEIIPDGKSLSRLVVDSYAIDVEWEEQLRLYTEEIFVIDDLANRRHDCDILLDQNSYLDKEHRYDGLVSRNCKLLLGHEHALLREEFYKAKKKMIPRDKRNGIKNILVFFGGADATNETMKALRALKSIESQIKDVTINVVVGGSNPYKAEVKAFCNQNDNMRYLCQVNNMAELMAEADLAIGAGGTTTWERLFLDLPSIVICIADNQRKGCEDCLKQGWINYLGIYSDVLENDIIKMVSKFLQKYT